MQESTLDARPNGVDTERTALLPKPKQDPARPKNGLDRAKTSPLKVKLLMTSMMLSAFLLSLDMTIVATCIPSISSDLKASDQGSWLGTSYLAATVTFTPLYGRLSDIVGRRNAYVQSLALFGIGTLACALANNLLALAISRFVAGMGGGGIGVVASVIVGGRLFELFEGDAVTGDLKQIFSASVSGGSIKASSSSAWEPGLG